MHAVQVGEAAFCKCAHQVERACGLMVCLYQTLWVWHSCIKMRSWVVHHVAAEHWQLVAVHHFGVVRTRLRKLSGNAANLHHGYAHGVGKHHSHLQNHAQLFANVYCSKFFEAFGTVAGLQQKCVAACHLAKCGLQRASLTCKHQRRKRRDLFQRAVKVRSVGPVWLLHGRECLP